MSPETKGEQRLDRWLARANTPRGAAIVIGGVTTAITVIAGLLMTIVDHKNFPSLGGGLWWAVQTVTTVGYGDHVPTNVTGKLVATFVMLLGIGFITVISASITSSFIQRFRQPAAPDSVATAESLRAIDSRLERIEAALSARD
jgi:voltage-gated potassium channel